MAKAIWNDIVLAESNDIVIVEENYYFPHESIQQEYFQPSPTETFCHWKGYANYYHLVVNGQTNPDAAWFYKQPYEKAQHIQNRVAFWKGVEVK